MVVLVLDFIYFSEELRSTFHLIFGENATVYDKKEAYLRLQSWKVRRSSETLTGVFCTLSLLDVHIKDITGLITDPFTLSTLYASTLTKFLNFAASFQLREATMYRSAHRLGLDSFLVDLRHLCSHGKQLPNVEVFRKSHRYCLDWIKRYFWENELKNVSDATLKHIRYDETMGEKLKTIFPFYDTLAELLHKNVADFQDLTVNDSMKARWPTLEKFMRQKKLKSFRQAFNFLTSILKKIIESKMMSQNPRTFFYEMFECCDYFMQASESSDIATNGLILSEEDDDEEDEKTEAEGSPPKRKKTKPTTIVNLFQHLVWQIAKHDYLKMFLDMLYQISMNESEDSKRRTAARFWITITLGSFRYYQRYCKFSPDNPILQTKITPEVKNIYSYQLDADLKKVFIFVGTQLLPSSLKYSREFYIQVLNNVDANNEAICVNLLPFVYPPLSSQQLDEINDLVKIGTCTTRKGQKSTADKVYSIEDLLPSKHEKSTTEKSDLIWGRSLDSIDWSSQPIGKDFSIVS